MPRAIVYKIRPDHPEAFKIAKVTKALGEGAVVLYPTDTVYAIGCDPHCKSAVDRIRAIRQLSIKKPLTLLCPSLAEISRYAHVDDAAFRLMKTLTPGPFTFLLKATKVLPKLVLNPKRKVIGLRIPEAPICQALLARNGGLLVSISAKLPSGEAAIDCEELCGALAPHVDVIIDEEGAWGATPSTVLDLTTPNQEVVREGMGMDLLYAHMR